MADSSMLIELLKGVEPLIAYPASISLNIDSGTTLVEDANMLAKARAITEESIAVGTLTLPVHQVLVGLAQVGVFMSPEVERVGKITIANTTVENHLGKGNTTKKAVCKTENNRS